MKSIRMDESGGDVVRRYSESLNMRDEAGVRRFKINAVST